MDDLQGTPFVNRKMLSFETGTAFSLRISCQTVDSLTLTVRGMTREGIFTFAYETTPDGLIHTEVFPLADLPIMVTVSDEAGILSEGDCYVTLSLLANGDKLHELAAGYVYQGKSISFPASLAQPHREPTGHLQIVESAAPATGSELMFTVPDGVQWEVLAIYTQLVTSATVANRRVHFVLGASNLQINCFNDQDHAASLTRNYSVAPFGEVIDRLDDNDILVNLPRGIQLDQGMLIMTETTNLQAGDAFGTMRVLVRSTITPSS